MLNVDVSVTIFLILPTRSSRTGAQDDVSFQAQCSTSSAEEQVAVPLWLCLHVLTREQLAEMYCQACASGAFLSVLLPCMAPGGCTLRWPGRPGSVLLAVDLLQPRRRDGTAVPRSVHIPAESPFSVLLLMRADKAGVH